MSSAVSRLALPSLEQRWCRSRGSFLLIFGLMGGFLGTGPAALMIGALIPKWFVHRRGRAVATATMGTGLAGFLLAPVVTIIS